MADAPRNWFAEGGDAYARFRPAWPDGIASFLADLAPGRRLALDAGCGGGQLTLLLGGHFERVIGCDPAGEQIAHAPAHPNVRYVAAPAEALPAPDASVSLITAAQAAHWFDLPRFYDEVRRVAAPGAPVALLSYGVARLGDPDLDARFRRFCYGEMGPFWPPGRRLVQSGYAGLPFPFRELQPPPFEITAEWPAEAFVGYLSTWSAVKRAGAQGETALARFAAELGALWGDPDRPRRIVWPVRMRLGVVEKDA